MAKYSIQDTTLTAIGDAIRNKTGKHTRPGTETYMKTIPEVMISKTSNAPGFNNLAVQRPLVPGINIDVIRFPGANSIFMDYCIEFYKVDGSEYLQIAVGEYDETNFPVDTIEKIYATGTPRYSRQHTTFENTEVITIRSVVVSTQYYLGYYAECKAFDADGNPMGEYQVEAEREVEVPNTLTPAQMATEIEGLSIYEPPAEAFNLTGDLTYRFSYNGWNWFIDDFGDRITTSDINSIQSAFAHSGKLETIPFDINMREGREHVATEAFYDSPKLKSLPEIYNFKPSGLGSFMNTCRCVRELPESFLTWDLSAMQTGAYNSYSNMFSNCHSLRSIPSDFLKRLYQSGTGYYYHIYNNFSLETVDELIGMPVTPAALTSNVFSGCFKQCSRVTDIIFDTNEDGSAKIVTWKKQAIDCSQYVGYHKQHTASTPYYQIDNFNSGITRDKEVTDDATYQALKNDPDWFTFDMNYSRYNHTSAVNTINSLPDVSAGSDNTIKFLGASGTNTDGGAISNLTEEEIAVAAAKGWTVTLVQKGDNL